MSTETFDGLDYDFNPTKQKSAEVKAQERGLVIVYPSAYELQIDIDSPEDLARFNHSAKQLDGFQIIKDWKIHKSPSGVLGHYHVTVRLRNDVTPIERIFLQALLGSDVKRELLCWRELARFPEDRTTLFFESTELEATAERANAVYGVKTLCLPEKRSLQPASDALSSAVEPSSSPVFEAALPPSLRTET